MKVGDAVKVASGTSEWVGREGIVDRADPDPSVFVLRFGSRLGRVPKADLAPA